MPKKLTTEEFKKRAKEKHGDKYDYTEVNYIDAFTKVDIKCNVVPGHGTFPQTPNHHLSGSGCPKCSGNIKSTTEEFIKKAKIKHGENKYDYSEVNYINAYTDVIIKCNLPGHGTFPQTPDKHLNRGSGCPKCAKQYSKMQIEWLNFISKKDNIIIQHAENEGEYIIPNTRFKADGYCKETDTIYEFHGSYWHGDPKKYQSEKINTHMNKSFGELYERTLKKMNHCREQGYTVVECWESDWRKACKAVILLQRKFRKRREY